MAGWGWKGWGRWRVKGSGRIQGRGRGQVQLELGFQGHGVLDSPVLACSRAGMQACEDVCGGGWQWGSWGGALGGCGGGGVQWGKSTKDSGHEAGSIQRCAKPFTNRQGNLFSPESLPCESCFSPCAHPPGQACSEENSNA